MSVNAKLFIALTRRTKRRYSQLIKQFKQNKKAMLPQACAFD